MTAQTATSGYLEISAIDVREPSDKEAKQTQAHPGAEQTYEKLLNFYVFVMWCHCQPTCVP